MPVEKLVANRASRGSLPHQSASLASPRKASSPGPDRAQRLAPLSRGPTRAGLAHSGARHVGT